MKTRTATSRLRAPRGVALAILIGGATALFAPQSARAFVLSVGPTSGFFGGYVCADVVNGSLTPNELVQAFDCNAAPNQQYEFNGLAIYALGGQRCLDVPGFNDGSMVVRSNVCNGSLTQQWTGLNGVIFNLGAIRCLDATQMTNGTALVVNTCEDPKSPIVSQHWQMK